MAEASYGVQSSSKVPRGRSCRRERLAHPIQKFLRHNLYGIQTAQKVIAAAARFVG